MALAVGVAAEVVGHQGGVFRLELRTVHFLLASWLHGPPPPLPPSLLFLAGSCLRCLGGW